jgi:hypothetical protein
VELLISYKWISGGAKAGKQTLFCLIKKFSQNTELFKDIKLPFQVEDTFGRFIVKKGKY